MRKLGELIGRFGPSETGDSLACDILPQHSLREVFEDVQGYEHMIDVARRLRDSGDETVVLLESSDSDFLELQLRWDLCSNFNPIIRDGTEYRSRQVRLTYNSRKMLRKRPSVFFVDESGFRQEMTPEHYVDRLKTGMVGGSDDASLLDGSGVLLPDEITLRQMIELCVEISSHCLDNRNLIPSYVSPIEYNLLSFD